MTLPSLHRWLRTYRGGYHRLCAHRSHVLRLPCYRACRWDGYCGHHNQTCWEPCAFEARALKVSEAALPE